MFTDKNKPRFFTSAGISLPAPFTKDGSFQGFSVFALKIVAIIGMTCNHVANVFAGDIPFVWLVVIYGFGGVTFPIFAFLLIEGYTHTSNLRLYLLRLLIFALISQIPFSLLWGIKANVIFTLLLGLLLLYAYDHLTSKLLFVLVFLSAVIFSDPWMDWGGLGPILIVLFYVLRKPPFQLGTKGVVITMVIPMVLEGAEALMATIATLPSAFSLDLISGSSYFGHNTILAAGAFATSLGSFLYYTLGFGIALAFMLLYNGRHGRPMKWLFYAYYPLHLMVLWAIEMLII